MSKRRPEFHIARVNEDGTREDPQVMPVTAMPWDTTMDRRGALGVGLVAAAVLAFADRAVADQARRPPPAPVPTTEAPEPALKAHTNRVSTLASVSDGKLLVSSSDDNTLKIWAPSESRLVATLVGHTDDVTAAAAAADGSVAVSASKDGSIRLWSLSAGKLLVQIPGHDQPVETLAISPDGKLVASGSIDRTIKLWSIPSGRLIGTLEGHTGPVRALAVSPDGRLLVSGSDDKAIRFWSLESGQLLKTLEGHTAAVTRLSLSVDRVASGADNGAVKIWSLLDGASLITIEAHKRAVRALHLDGQRGVLASATDAFVKFWSLADGTSRGEVKANSGVSALTVTATGLASGDDHGSIVLWDLSPERFKSFLHDPALTTVAVTKQLRAHAQGVSVLTMAADGKTLLSASRDKTLKVWSIPDGSLVSRLLGHEGAVTSAVLHPDGKTIVSASADKSIFVWSPGDAPPAATRPVRGKPPERVRAGVIQRRLQGHTEAIAALALSHDGKTLVSSSRDRTVRTWTLPDGASGIVLTGPTPANLGLVLSSDGTTIACASTDAVRTWSAVDGRLLALIKSQSGSIQDTPLAMSPDARTLAIGNLNSELSLWSISSGRRIPMTGRHSGVTTLQFVSNGSRLVSGGGDGACCIWSIADRQLVGRCEGSSGPGSSVAAMATTPDGSLLAAGYSDGRVELWNLSSGQLLASFKGEAYVGITAMAFTPDGKWLVAGDASGAIMLWDLERNAFHGFLFDPTANGADTKGLSYNVYDRITGHTITYTLPCGSPLPAGAVCTCNCVPGTVAVPRPTGGGVSGGTYCRCNKICTCVPISSRRWKTHVRPLTRTIDLVMRLEAMRYEWTPDAPHGRQGSDIGFIAEDVAAIVPEIVSIDADGRASGVDYARVTVLLVEAVKQQQKEIAALQTLLRDLVPQG